MFAVIYRRYVKVGFEAKYQKHWKVVATYFTSERGALGSSLHKAENGMWIAYSKWPDKATRDASWLLDETAISLEFPLFLREAIQGLKDCLEVVDQPPDICMEVIEEVKIPS